VVLKYYVIIYDVVNSIFKKSFYIVRNLKKKVRPPLFFPPKPSIQTHLKYTSK